MSHLGAPGRHTSEMLTLLRFTNVALILAMIGCVAGALAGLIVLLPFVAGAWLLNLVALVGYRAA